MESAFFKETLPMPITTNNYAFLRASFALAFIGPPNLSAIVGGLPLPRQY